MSTLVIHERKREALRTWRTAVVKALTKELPTSALDQLLLISDAMWNPLSSERSYAALVDGLVSLQKADATRFNPAAAEAGDPSAVAMINVAIFTLVNLEARANGPPLLCEAIKAVDKILDPPTGVELASMCEAYMDPTLDPVLFSDVTKETDFDEPPAEEEKEEPRAEASGVTPLIRRRITAAELDAETPPGTPVKSTTPMSPMQKLMASPAAKSIIAQMKARHQLEISVVQEDLLVAEESRDKVEADKAKAFERIQALEKSVKTLQSANNRLQAQVDEQLQLTCSPSHKDLKGQLERLRVDLRDKHDEIWSLTEQLKQWSQFSTSSSVTESELRLSHALVDTDYQKRCDELAMDNLRLASDADNEKASRRAQVDDLLKRLRDVTDRNDELSCAAHNSERLQKEQHVLRVELEGATDRLRHLDDEVIPALKDRLANVPQLEARLADAEGKLADQETVAFELSDQLSLTQDHNEGLAAQLVALQAQLGDFEAEKKFRASLEAHVDRLTEQRDDADARLTRARQEEETQRRRADEFQVALQESQLSARRVAADMELLHARVKELETQQKPTFQPLPCTPVTTRRTHNNGLLLTPFHSNRNSFFPNADGEEMEGDTMAYDVIGRGVLRTEHKDVVVTPPPPQTNIKRRRSRSPLFSCFSISPSHHKKRSHSQTSDMTSISSAVSFSEDQLPGRYTSGHPEDPRVISRMSERAEALARHNRTLPPHLRSHNPIEWTYIDEGSDINSAIDTVRGAGVPRALSVPTEQVLNASEISSLSRFDEKENQSQKQMTSTPAPSHWDKSTPKDPSTLKKKGAFGRVKSLAKDTFRRSGRRSIALDDSSVSAVSVPSAVPSNVTQTPGGISLTFSPIRNFKKQSKGRKPLQSAQ